MYIHRHVVKGHGVYDFVCVCVFVCFACCVYILCTLYPCVLCVCPYRAVHREEMKILRKRVSDCVRREEVNHLQRCRPQYMAYWKSYRKYRSEGDGFYTPGYPMFTTYYNTCRLDGKSLIYYAMYFSVDCYSFRTAVSCAFLYRAY